MSKILILGANGQLARNTTGFFLKHPDVQLTLYLRGANRLTNPDPSRVNIVEGDVLDAETLTGAMRGQDAVYANLAGAMKQQAETIVIEASDLNYTILRPGWFTQDKEINYQITQKGEPFKGHDVSLNSLSDLIVKLALTPGMEVRHSLGVNRVGHE